MLPWQRIVALQIDGTSSIQIASQVTLLHCLFNVSAVNIIFKVHCFCLVLKIALFAHSMLCRDCLVGQKRLRPVYTERERELCGKPGDFPRDLVF